MKINTIDINANEWCEKANGNSYFSGTIVLNYGAKTEKVFDMPLQYGYGNHYIDMAKELLQEKGILPKDAKRPLWVHCQDNDIILRTNKITGCKKSELK